MLGSRKSSYILCLTFAWTNSIVILSVRYDIARAFPLYVDLTHKSRIFLDSRRCRSSLLVFALFYWNIDSSFSIEKGKCHYNYRVLLILLVSKGVCSKAKLMVSEESASVKSLRRFIIIFICLFVPYLAMSFLSPWPHFKYLTKFNTFPAPTLSTPSLWATVALLVGSDFWNE